MTNTRLQIGYHGSSLSTSETVVLSNAITQEQIDQISRGAFDGEMIIAPQVHLPSPLENYLALNGIDIEPDDHVLTTLEDWAEGSPSPECLHTDEEPTHEIDIGVLAAHIESIGPDGWRFDIEEERLGIPEEEFGDSLHF